MHPPFPLPLPLPLRSWDFLGWLIQPRRMEFYEKAAVVAVALRVLGIVIAVSTGGWSNRGAASGIGGGNQAWALQRSVGKGSCWGNWAVG